MEPEKSDVNSKELNENNTMPQYKLRLSKDSNKRETHEHNKIKEQSTHSANHSPETDKFLEKALLQENYLEISMQNELQKLKEQISGNSVNNYLLSQQQNQKLGLQIRTNSQISEINSLIKNNLHQNSFQLGDSYSRANNEGITNDSQLVNESFSQNPKSNNHAQKERIGGNSTLGGGTTDDLPSPYFPQNGSLCSDQYEINQTSKKKIQYDQQQNNSLSSLERVKENNKTQESNKLYENFAQTYRQVKLKTNEQQVLENQNYPEPRRGKHNGYLPGQLVRKFKEDRIVHIFPNQLKSKNGDQLKNNSLLNSSQDGQEGGSADDKKVKFDLDYNPFKPKIAIDSSKIFKNLRGPLFYQRNLQPIKQMNANNQQNLQTTQQQLLESDLEAKRRNSMDQIISQEFSKNPHELIGDDGFGGKSPRTSQIQSQSSNQNYNVRNPDDYLKMLIQYANPPVESEASNIKKQQFFSQLSVPHSPDKEQLSNYNRLKFLSQTTRVKKNNFADNDPTSYLDPPSTAQFPQQNSHFKVDEVDPDQKRHQQAHSKPKRTNQLFNGDDRNLLFLLKMKNNNMEGQVEGEERFRQGFLNKTYNVATQKSQLETGFRSHRSQEHSPVAAEDKGSEEIFIRNYNQPRINALSVGKINQKAALHQVSEFQILKLPKTKDTENTGHVKFLRESGKKGSINHENEPKMSIINANQGKRVDVPNYGEPQVPKTLSSLQEKSNEAEIVVTNKQANRLADTSREYRINQDQETARQNSFDDSQQEKGTQTQKKHKQKRKLNKKEKLKLNEFRNIMGTYSMNNVFINSKGLVIQNN